MTAGVEFRPATWEIDAPAATALVMPVAFTLDGNDYPWDGVEIVARVLSQRTRAPLATMTVDATVDGQLVLSLTADQVSALGAARFVWHLDIDAVPVLAGRFQVHPEGSPFPARRTGPTVQVSTGGIEATVGLGLAASLEIGVVETLNAGADATASIDGTATQRVLNLGIPGGLLPVGGSTAGRVLASSAGGAVWQQKMSVDVRDFGAVGDGVTNDAAALQAAIDAAEALDGAVVSLPAGTFVVSSDVSISKPVTIRGSGRDVTEIRVNAARFVADSDDVTIEDVAFTAAADQWLLKTQTSATDLARWVFQRCRFDKVGLSLSACNRDLGNGSTEATGTRVASAVVVRDCEFFGRAGNETMFIAGTNGVVVDSCWIHDCGTDTNNGEGIKVLHAAYGTRITNNLIERTTRDGIDAYNSIDTTIAHNVIRDPGVCGIEIKWTTTDTFHTSRTIVTANRVEGSGGPAYNLDAPETIAIGNIARDAGGSGFRFSTNSDGGGTATPRGLFVGNMALAGASDGFTGSLATGAVFVGNGAHGNTGIGFSLTGPQSLIGNVASGNGTDYNASGQSGHTAFWGNTGSSTPFRVPNNVPIAGYNAAGTLFELLKLTSGGSLNIGTTAAGGPGVGLLVPSGSGITLFGRLLAAAGATYDIGQTATRFRDLFLSGGANVGSTTFTPRAATGTPNNTLFVDSADNTLKFRDNGGTVRVVNLT